MHNIDLLKLLREGTTQEQRFLPVLNPVNVPIDAHEIAHKIVFAKELSAHLVYYSNENIPFSDWTDFFNQDVSVPLAIASIQNIDDYKKQIQTLFAFLNDNDHAGNLPELKETLGELFSAIASMAKQFDLLLDPLPDDIPLKGSLQNLIRTRLAASFKKLIEFYLEGVSMNLIAVDTTAKMRILQNPCVSLKSVLNEGLSSLWIINATGWSAYLSTINASLGAYGTGSVFTQINHLATHQLFKNIFDEFLRAYAKVVELAGKDLKTTLEKWNRHSPHYALFLSFLRLSEYVREKMNSLTGKHLDFYYRDILRLKEKEAVPGKVHLLAELAKHADTHLFKQGELFKAGKDDLKNEAFFANKKDVVLNKAKVSALKTVYRHNAEPLASSSAQHLGRIFASPIANSDDGLKPELTSDPPSWHPFFHKKYLDGQLVKIEMPAAEIGFAIASHYLFLAEGTRKIEVTLHLTELNPLPEFPIHAFRCMLTTEKGWISKPISDIDYTNFQNGFYKISIDLDGNDEAITSYNTKTHGYNLNTTLPVLFIKLRQNKSETYAYNTFANAVIQSLKLEVTVTGMETLSVSNDFGPVDTSKPFQPYGPSPISGQSLIIGSKEIFQKKLNYIHVNLNWLTTPTPYGNVSDIDAYATREFHDITLLLNKQFDPTDVLHKFDNGRVIKVQPAFLNLNKWNAFGSKLNLYNNTYALENNLDSFSQDHPDPSENAFYGTESRNGFVRFSLVGDLGQKQHHAALIDFLNFGGNNPGPVPTSPTLSSISIDYQAAQDIPLNTSSNSGSSDAAYFHFAPFGQPLQDPRQNGVEKIFFLPQFDFQRGDLPVESEAEFYIGITELKPPQNLALLFQVLDGTADPLTEKPEAHIQWSFLSNNRWINFRENEIQDQTGALLHSGIITFAFPREATDTNTLLPKGMHWIRAAVENKSNAICQLLLVAAQALQAPFEDHQNDPVFGANALAAGTISKMQFPVAEIKKIEQPFPSFGGKGKESPSSFYTRVSERLRHKDRAVTLWDYEHLILENFPSIYRVKCLNHTEYEPSPDNTGIYRELAPGHVTIVTIPVHRSNHCSHPLKPFTSLGLLKDIESFLKQRISCFVKLHVRNPRFEEVRISARVRFNDGVDEAFHQVKLQEAITRYLSPWAFTRNDAPAFGGKIYKSSLIHFVEEQSYVDYITDFEVYQDIQGVPGSIDLNIVEGSMAVSVLVSVPAAKHTIHIISPIEEEENHETCLCSS